jgi:hypothetical protein
MGIGYSTTEHNNVVERKRRDLEKLQRAINKCNRALGYDEEELDQSQYNWGPESFWRVSSERHTQVLDEIKELIAAKKAELSRAFETIKERAPVQGEIEHLYDPDPEEYQGRKHRDAHVADLQLSAVRAGAVGIKDVVIIYHQHWLFSNTCYEHHACVANFVMP